MNIFGITYYILVRLLALTLTHISLASYLWDIGKQCKTRSDAADLHCLLTEVSFKIWIKLKIPPNNPLNGIGLVHLIIVGNFIQLKWVKSIAFDELAIMLAIKNTKHIGQDKPFQ